MGLLNFIRQTVSEYHGADMAHRFIALSDEDPTEEQVREIGHERGEQNVEAFYDAFASVWNRHVERYNAAIDAEEADDE